MALTARLEATPFQNKIKTGDFQQTVQPPAVQFLFQDSVSWLPDVAHPTYYFTATPNGKLSVVMPVVVGLSVPVAGVIAYCEMLAEL